MASVASEHQFKIIYACESGSRAWGFPSPVSDYVLRFVYVHPWNWYLTLEEDRDVVDLPLEDSSVGLLDLGGWDLRKTLRLLRKSNPVIWEWLQSPVCYQAEQTQRNYSHPYKNSPPHKHYMIDFLHTNSLLSNETERLRFTAN